MANERLRAALARDRWSVSGFADALSVDHKTVERWITTDRTPHRTTIIAAAKLLNEDPAYLWPNTTYLRERPARRGRDLGFRGLLETKRDS